jgi:hypothetical protein
MITIKQRLADLKQAGFKPFKHTFLLGADYGLNTEDYDTITYADGLELVTDFTRIQRRGDFRLTERTHVNYVHCRDGEMPLMLKFMQPRMTEGEMAELLRPMEPREEVRAVNVGKRQIAKLKILVDRDVVNYHINFQFHRIWQPTFFRNLAGLGKGYDILLPHPDYYRI